MAKKDDSNWTFLTNHSHVILCLAKDDSMRIRDLAVKIGITERAVQRILAELVEAGYIEINKMGRCNVYRLIKTKPLKHPVESHKNISDLIHLITEQTLAESMKFL